MTLPKRPACSFCAFQKLHSQVRAQHNSLAICREVETAACCAPTEQPLLWFHFQLSHFPACLKQSLPQILLEAGGAASPKRWINICGVYLYEGLHNLGGEAFGSYFVFFIKPVLQEENTMCTVNVKTYNKEEYVLTWDRSSLRIQSSALLFETLILFCCMTSEHPKSVFCCS